MARYLLDTNHVSPLVTLGHHLRDRVLNSMQAGNSFAICVPVLTETLVGLATVPRAKQNLVEFRLIRPSLGCYVPDETDAELAADFQISLRKKGRQLGTIDALVAAIALRNDLTLLTTDGDFRWVPLLRRENWMRTTLVS